jgi:nucleoside-diphosphate-sugar epimerase
VINLDFLNNKKLLITGGTGFFGKNILDLIIKHKVNLNKLTLVTRDIAKFKTSYANFHLLNNLDFIETDICNLDYHNQKYDYILHAATNIIEKTENIELSNDIIIGTNKILEFAVKAEVTAFINFSSGAVYGNFDLFEKKTENTNPIIHLSDLKSTYGLAKLYAEHLVYLYTEKYKFKALTLRFFVGAGNHIDKAHYAISEFISKTINNQDIVVYAGKNIYRSYLAVDEMMSWMFFLLKHAINHDIRYKVYNIGSDEAISLPELAYKVRDVLNVKIKVSCPNMDNKSIIYYIPNIDQVKSLGLTAQTSLDKMILQVANYFKIGV